MKKYLIILLLVLISIRVDAVPAWSQESSSVPSGSQYISGRNYGFQINWNDASGISTVLFEWNGVNYTTLNISDTFYYNLTDLAAGSYNFKWYANNTLDEYSSSDQWSYIVSQNTSVSIILYLNGTERDRSYLINRIANFTAFLNIPSKTVYLDSTLPNWVQQSSSNSILYNLTNLSSSGIFSITASFNGDQNYSSSSKTYYFDTIPPEPYGVVNIPESPVGYIPGTEHQLKSSWRSATLKNVWFESNHTGSFKNYTATSNLSVQNSSGVFWITLTKLGAGKFSYRWFASDELNRVGYTNRTVYEILKMTPLTISILPSTTITLGTQVTASCSSVNPLEVPSSKFTFYRNDKLIDNISSTTRMEAPLLDTGQYNYTCNVSSIGNYSNQTLTVMLTVMSGTPLPNVTGDFKITGTTFPTMETGKTGEASFNIVNNIGRNLANITIDLIGISSEWYTVINKPSTILTGSSSLIRVNFNIPSTAESKTYGITIKTTGETVQGELKTATGDVQLTITSAFVPPENTPPILSGEEVDTTIAGAEAQFNLEIADDYGLSGYIFSTNNSGLWENDSWVPLEGTESQISVLKVLNSDVDQMIAWRIYANDSIDKWTASEEYILKTTKAEFSIDLLTPILVVVVIIVLIFLIFFIRKKRHVEEEIEYVYNKEDAGLSILI